MTKQTIPVEIQGQQYRIRSNGDRESVEQAARLVDETMGKLRDRSTVVDSLDIAVLAALNLANQFIGLREREGQHARAEEAQQIQSLVELVESALPAGSLSPH